MNREEFKLKWFDNAFYWINEENCIILQEIMQRFGILSHCWSHETIPYNPRFKNLVTFKPDVWHDYEYYQQVDMWIPGARYGEPKDYKQMIKEYAIFNI